MTIQTTHLKSETQNSATRHFVILPTHHAGLLGSPDSPKELKKQVISC